MRRRAVAVVLVWTAILGSAPVSGKPANEAACTLERGEAKAVVRVIDGETLALEDGSEVRLIGALAPRATDAEGASALEHQAMAALADLVLGRSVVLGFAGRRTDRYDHILAHVFVLRDGGETWVQGWMLEHGYARAYGLPGSFACIAEMLEQERRARQMRAGLWSHAAYAPRAAEHTHELVRYRNTYQLVVGRLTKVTTVKGRVYLNFGADWREDFTASFAIAALREHSQWLAGIAAFEGKRVRVRGWIERRNGPYMEILHPSQIELLEERSAPEPPADAPSVAAPPEMKRPARMAPGALDL